MEGLANMQQGGFISLNVVLLMGVSMKDIGIILIMTSHMR